MRKDKSPAVNGEQVAFLESGRDPVLLYDVRVYKDTDCFYVVEYRHKCTISGGSR
jgi:hypothetical protein